MPTKSSTEIDPMSPEGILERVEPQFRELTERHGELVAEDSRLRTEVQAINERALRMAPLPDDDAGALWRRVQAISDQLYDLSRAIDKMHPQIAAARAAVEGGAVDRSLLNAAVVTAQAELDRLVVEHQEAIDGRDAAYESGTAEEAFKVERTLRLLPGRVADAQSRVIVATLAELEGERSQLGRQKWEADEAVRVAAEQVAAAQRSHALAVETRRGLEQKGAYIAEHMERLRSQLGSDLAALAMSQAAA